MRQGRFILFFTFFVLFTSACHEWIEIIDEIVDDDWDSDYYGGGSSSSSGDSQVSSTLWRCPETDFVVDEEFPAAFSDITLISPDASTEALSGNLNFYALILSGPTESWQTEGTDFDPYEYYFFELTNGDVLVLNFVEQLPADDSDNQVRGTYSLFPAETGLTTASLTEFFEDLSDPFTVLQGFDPTDVYEGVLESGAIDMSLTKEGEGVYLYEMDLLLGFLSEGLDVGDYALSFRVTTETENFQISFRDAYAVERQSEGITDDYLLTVYVDDQIADTATNTEADVVDFFDTCGPGSEVENPVLYNL